MHGIITTTVALSVTHTLPAADIMTYTAVYRAETTQPLIPTVRSRSVTQVCGMPEISVAVAVV